VGTAPLAPEQARHVPPDPTEGVVPAGAAEQGAVPREVDPHAAPLPRVYISVTRWNGSNDSVEIQNCLPLLGVINSPSSLTTRR